MPIQHQPRIFLASSGIRRAFRAGYVPVASTIKHRAVKIVFIRREAVFSSRIEGTQSTPLFVIQCNIPGRLPTFENRAGLQNESAE
jgi:hypothetical protein